MGVRCGGWPRQSRWGVRGQFYNMAPTIMFTAVVLSALMQIGCSLMCYNSQGIGQQCAQDEDACMLMDQVYDGKTILTKECTNTKSEKTKKALEEVGLSVGKCVENKKVDDPDGKKVTINYACLCDFDLCNFDQSTAMNKPLKCYQEGSLVTCPVVQRGLNEVMVPDSCFIGENDESGSFKIRQSCLDSTSKEVKEKFDEHGITMNSCKENIVDEKDGEKLTISFVCLCNTDGCNMSKAKALEEIKKSGGQIFSSHLLHIVFTTMVLLATLN